MEQLKIYLGPLHQSNNTFQYNFLMSLKLYFNIVLSVLIFYVCCDVEFATLHKRTH